MEARWSAQDWASEARPASQRRSGEPTSARAELWASRAACSSVVRPVVGALVLTGAAEEGAWDVEEAAAEVVMMTATVVDVLSADEGSMVVGRTDTTLSEEATRLSELLVGEGEELLGV